MVICASGSRPIGRCDRGDHVFLVHYFPPRATVKFEIGERVAAVAPLAREKRQSWKSGKSGKSGMGAGEKAAGAQENGS